MTPLIDMLVIDSAQRVAVTSCSIRRRRGAGRVRSSAAACCNCWPGSAGSFEAASSSREMRVPRGLSYHFSSAGVWPALSCRAITLRTEVRNRSGPYTASTRADRRASSVAVAFPLGGVTAAWMPALACGATLASCCQSPDFCIRDSATSVSTCASAGAFSASSTTGTSQRQRDFGDRILGMAGSGNRRVLMFRFSPLPCAHHQGTIARCSDPPATPPPVSATPAAPTPARSPRPRSSARS